MKLRIQCNSIRIQMDRRDLTELLNRGRVIDVLRFGPDSNHTFTYTVVVGTATPSLPHAHYALGLLVVTIDRGDAAAWAEGERAGFDHEQVVEGGTLRVILEKDFASPDRPKSDVRGVAGALPTRGSPAGRGYLPMQAFR